MCRLSLSISFIVLLVSCINGVVIGQDGIGNALRASPSVTPDASQLVSSSIEERNHVIHNSILLAEGTIAPKKCEPGERASWNEKEKKINCYRCNAGYHFEGETANCVPDMNEQTGRQKKDYFRFKCDPGYRFDGDSFNCILDDKDDPDNPNIGVA